MSVQQNWGTVGHKPNLEEVLSQLAARPKVLCIDDQDTGLIVRKALLERRGYNVFIARTGQEGIEMFKRTVINAVVVDYDMPVMDGAQVAEKIRELNPSVPIIMLSGYTSVPQAMRALLTAFVEKGQPPDVLLQELERVLPSA